MQAIQDTLASLFDTNSQSRSELTANNVYDSYQQLITVLCTSEKGFIATYVFAVLWA